MLYSSRKSISCGWLTRIKKILCTNGFSCFSENHGVGNGKQIVRSF